MAAQDGSEAVAVGGLDDVRQFVNQHVFKARERLLGQVGVEADGGFLGVAAAPFGLHLADEDGPRLDLQNALPLGEQRRHGSANLGTVPGRKALVPLCLAGTGANCKYQLALAQLDGWSWGLDRLPP